MTQISVISIISQLSPNPNWLKLKFWLTVILMTAPHVSQQFPAGMNESLQFKTLSVQLTCPQIVSMASLPSDYSQSLQNLSRET